MHRRRDDDAIIVNQRRIITAKGDCNFLSVALMS
jgi:hypothetical protein